MSHRIMANWLNSGRFRRAQFSNRMGAVLALLQAAFALVHRWLFGNNTNFEHVGLCTLTEPF